MVICLSHWILSYKLYYVRGPLILKRNKSHINRIIQIVPRKTALNKWKTNAIGLAGQDTKLSKSHISLLISFVLLHENNTIMISSTIKNSSSQHLS